MNTQKVACHMQPATKTGDVLTTKFLVNNVYIYILASYDYVKINKTC